MGRPDSIRDLPNVSFVAWARDVHILASGTRDLMHVVSTIDVVSAIKMARARVPVHILAIQCSTHPDPAIASVPCSCAPRPKPSTPESLYF